MTKKEDELAEMEAVTVATKVWESTKKTVNVMAVVSILEEYGKSVESKQEGTKMLSDAGFRESIPVSLKTKLVQFVGSSASKKL